MRTLKKLASLLCIILQTSKSLCSSLSLFHVTRGLHSAVQNPWCPSFRAAPSKSAARFLPLLISLHAHCNCLYLTSRLPCISLTLVLCYLLLSDTVLQSIILALPSDIFLIFFSTLVRKSILSLASSQLSKSYCSAISLMPFPPVGPMSLCRCYPHYDRAARLLSTFPTDRRSNKAKPESISITNATSITRLCSRLSAMRNSLVTELTTGNDVEYFYSRRP